MDVPNLVLHIDQIRKDARNGRLSVDKLVDIIEKQQQNIKRLVANERRLIERLTRYEPEASHKSTANQANSTTPTASYSLDAEMCPLRNACHFRAGNRWEYSPPLVQEIPALLERAADGPAGRHSL